MYSITGISNQQIKKKSDPSLDGSHESRSVHTTLRLGSCTTPDRWPQYDTQLPFLGRSLKHPRDIPTMNMMQAIWIYISKSESFKATLPLGVKLGYHQMVGFVKNHDVWVVMGGGATPSTHPTNATCRFNLSFHHFCLAMTQTFIALSQLLISLCQAVLDRLITGVGHSWRMMLFV